MGFFRATASSDDIHLSSGLLLPPNPAIYLCTLLHEHHTTAQPRAFSLLALGIPDPCTRQKMRRKFSQTAKRFTVPLNRTTLEQLAFCLAVVLTIIRCALLFVLSRRPMEQLGPTLTEFYAPTTSNERKQQLEQGLHAFRTQPNAHLDSLQIITHIVSVEFSFVFACSV